MVATVAAMVAAAAAMGRAVAGEREREKRGDRIPIHSA
jgi:hypothetical protein